MSEGKRGPLSLVDKVNYVIDFYNNPCDAPWLVYAETLFPAALEAVVSLEAFDPVQIVRTFSRPVGVRNRRHGRAGRKSGKRGFALPDWNEEVGEYFREQSGINKRHVTDGTKHAWLMLDVVEQGLWYWQLIDVVSQFAYRWTSLINRSVACHGGGRGAGLWTKTSAQAIPIVGWQGPGVGTVEYQHPPYITVLSGGLIEATFPVTVAMAVEMVNLNPGPNELGVGFFLDTDTTVPVVSKTVDFFTPGAAGAFIEFDLEPGHYVQPAIFATNLYNSFDGFIEWCH